jgi:hypothetical protein
VLAAPQAGAQPQAPLGWVLSQRSREYMNDALDQVWPRGPTTAQAQVPTGSDEGCISELRAQLQPR